MQRAYLLTEYFIVKNKSFWHNNVKSRHIEIYQKVNNMYCKICGIQVIEKY